MYVVAVGCCGVVGLVVKGGWSSALSGVFMRFCGDCEFGSADDWCVNKDVVCVDLGVGGDLLAGDRGGGLSS